MTTRRLAAILAADVVGFSKLIREDETATLAALRECRSAGNRWNLGQAQPSSFIAHPAFQIFVMWLIFPPSKFIT
jgi:hypothetical protein